jgi:glycosyltransferase involved in cell wall biosynthesis
MKNTPTPQEQTSAVPASIDVVVPVYNGQDFILRALQSIENQTLPPEKIIVVDDGSTDATGEILQTYRGRVPLKIITKEHSGLSATRNIGIAHCTSAYVAFLDADDEWVPRKLERQLQVFHRAEFPKLGAVYCEYEIIDERGDVQRDAYTLTIQPGIRGDVFSAILPKNLIASSASGILMLRECFLHAGTFDEHLQAAEDWDLWLRVAQHYQFDFVQEVLVKIRRHASNMQNDETRMFSQKLVFYNKWIPQLSGPGAIPHSWIKTILTTMLQRLPRRDFFQLYQSTMSAVSKKMLRRAIERRLKMYFFLKMLSLPFLMILRIVRRPVLSQNP